MTRTFGGGGRFPKVPKFQFQTPGVLLWPMRCTRMDMKQMGEVQGSFLSFQSKTKGSKGSFSSPACGEPGLKGLTERQKTLTGGSWARRGRAAAGLDVCQRDCRCVTLRRPPNLCQKGSHSACQLRLIEQTLLMETPAVVTADPNGTSHHPEKKPRWSCWSWPIPKRRGVGESPCFPMRLSRQGGPGSNLALNA